MLQQVCDDLQIDCYGYLPKSRDLEQGSRYLGLDFSEETENWELVRLLETHLDWEKLSLLSVSTAETLYFHGRNTLFPPLKQTVCIARNAESFSFLYRETIDRFERVTYFDPETESPDLEGIDLLYLPGGYPEKHLEPLVKNEVCRKTTKDFADRGGRIVAECGGMMYLCEKIVTDDGEYPMCGVLPYSITFRKADRKLSLGYRQFELDGINYRGHEFHYSQFMGTVPESIAQVYDAKGRPVPTPVFRYKNVLASYTHLYRSE